MNCTKLRVQSDFSCTAPYTELKNPTLPQPMNSHICIARCITLRITPKTSKQKGYFSTPLVPQFSSKQLHTQLHQHNRHGAQTEALLQPLCLKQRQPTQKDAISRTPGAGRTASVCGRKPSIPHTHTHTSAGHIKLSIPCCYCKFHTNMHILWWFINH